MLIKYGQIQIWRIKNQIKKNNQKIQNNSKPPIFNQMKPSQKSTRKKRPNSKLTITKRQVQSPNKSKTRTPTQADINYEQEQSKLISQQQSSPEIYCQSQSESEFEDQSNEKQKGNDGKVKVKGKQQKTRKKRYRVVVEDNDDDGQSYSGIKSPHMRVCEANKILRGEMLPQKFKFRQKQVSEIQSIIRGFMNGKNGKKGCKAIMITGSPGAGKTMSTNYILRKLQQEQNYKIIFLNSNQLKSKQEVQQILAQQLLPEIPKEKLPTSKIIEQLQTCSKLPPCILYIEEVQLFFNCHKEQFTQDFFDIFKNNKFKVLLVGISNTVDAMERYCDRLKIKAKQIKNIVFNPYTVQQIKEIIIDRMKQVEKVLGVQVKLEEKLARFIANKINEMKKGDMRLLFQFLKDLALQILPIQGQQLPQKIQITTENISKTFSTSKISKRLLLQSLPMSSKITLLSIYRYLVENDQISISPQHLKSKINETYRSIGLENKKTDNEIQNLIDYGMISVKKKIEKNGSSPKTRYLLNICFEDVRASFQGDAVLKNLL